MSWANGKIEVATGSATGRRFMEWLDDDPQSVFAVSMACDSWYQVFWEYSYLSGMTQTIIIQLYQISCISFTSVTF